jgi:hypothetical protein
MGRGTGRGLYPLGFMVSNLIPKVGDVFVSGNYVRIFQEGGMLLCKNPEHTWEAMWDGSPWPPHWRYCEVTKVQLILEKYERATIS